MTQLGFMTRKALSRLQQADCLLPSACCWCLRDCLRFAHRSVSCARPEVCAGTAGQSNNTYSSTAAAATASASVAHCGACGECSTLQDMDIYNVTRNSLTDAATRCALKALVGGRAAVVRCLDADVGFTPPCRDCWVDNIICDQRLCVFTCLRTIILGTSKNPDGTTLNRCLFCDERRCGTEFTLCAGANRRRSGITSDIARDEEDEVCKAVGSGWPWSP